MIALIAFPALFLSTSGFAQTDTARELKQLQDQREKSIEAAMAPINSRYVASLEQLLRRAMQTNDLDTANKVRAELQKLGVTASSSGAGPGSVLGQTDETRKNALRTHMRDTKWKMAGGKSFELRADGTTSSSWHGKKGTWKVIGPNTIELAISNSLKPRKATLDNDAATMTLGEQGDVDQETATRVEPRP
jgi:hypothetical protein